jgi:type VI secretion system protein ImpA
MDCDLKVLEERTAAALTGAEAVKQLESMLNELIGGAASPTFGALATLLQKISGFLKSTLARRIPSAGSPEAAGGEMVPGATPSGALSGEVRSRQDVVRALERILAYYAKHEPSSPVPLLVERCKRLVTMGFLDIIRDLAPDGVRQIEALSGQKQG